MTDELRNKDRDESSDDPLEDALDDVVPEASKTPLFQATHALRYQRQALIKQIEDQEKRQLICYVAGALAPIEPEDTVGFVDLLHNVSPGHDLDLLLHTTGGDIDAAEKLISMARTRAGTSSLRVIVPDYAKSAGTLMALGADAIVMSDSSELGPIDPQVIRADQHGNRLQVPIQSYLDAYEAHTEALKQNPQDVAAQIMLGQLDPSTVKLFQSIRRRAQTLAENLLKTGMFRDVGNWSLAASELLNTRRWQSHSQMISAADAQDPRLGLTVEVLPADGEIWRNYWLLHCLQRLAVGDREKLFESNYASLCIGCAR